MIVGGPAPGPFGKDESRNMKIFKTNQKDRKQRRKKNNKDPKKLLYVLLFFALVIIIGYFNSNF
ncbi:hypothetical protein [Natranaerofaba carboxydovora]|uniref:hypothetical protein n=1 Tax=Natranaerofaba carboxydovora TaxID=2742683 RepID=UPI001F12CED7|nr:hypothetical protein [Natranaerofaba carboxydovora]UMZ74398.1 hypothetical protein ACONDI_01986 [Natranaerofaba carboxydovora]